MHTIHLHNILINAIETGMHCLMQSDQAMSISLLVTLMTQVALSSNMSQSYIIID